MKESQRRWVLVLLLATVILGGSFYFYGAEPAASEKTVAPPPADERAAIPPGELYVYVSGAVNKPGVIKLPGGSRIVDAVAAAGGMIPGADQAKVNLAALLKDELHIHVPYLPLPAQPMSPANGNGAKNTGSNNMKVNINLAEKAELDRLPGVGPALAERIVEHRNTHGLFRDISDLKKVSGIGEAKYQQLKDQITL